MAVSAAAAAFVAAGATAAAAQVSATIEAKATVLQPLTVAVTNHLSFGNVYPGVDKTVGYTDAANSGKVTVMGHGGAEVNVTFSLPGELNGPSSSKLTVGSWTGCRSTTNSASSGCAELTPTDPNTTARLGTAPEGSSLYVFLGATVTPDYTQTPGEYLGTVTMTVAYTGN
jgi:hypothetical protein